MNTPRLPAFGEVATLFCREKECQTPKHAVNPC